MFKNILVLTAILVSVNFSQASASDRINCEVVKVLNSESGFQVGNEIQFTTDLDQVFMDDYSAKCEIIASEIRLVDEFKKKGNNVITVDKNAFREAVLKNTKPTDHGYRQQDYDRILAIK